MRSAILAVLAFLVGLTVGAFVFSSSGGPVPPSVEPPRDAPVPAHPGGYERVREGPPVRTDERGEEPGEAAPPPAPGTVCFSSSRKRVLEAIRAEYERYGGESFPEDVATAVLAEAEIQAGRIPAFTGSWLVRWEKLRRELGVLGDPPEMLIQLRGSYRRATAVRVNRQNRI